ncbi:uncharacterized protein LOC135397393 [Ornithodoros turicata]|uniref:uncharacterized protein LOC135397393 n=1 Tax=Ornithodoros turicata TaxID=34597 RepID=UPI003138E883
MLQSASGHQRNSMGNKLLISACLAAWTLLLWITEGQAMYPSSDHQDRDQGNAEVARDDDYPYYSPHYGSPSYDGYGYQRPPQYQQPYRQYKPVVCKTVCKPLKFKKKKKKQTKIYTYPTEYPSYQATYKPYSTYAPTPAYTTYRKEPAHESTTYPTTPYSEPKKDVKVVIIKEKKKKG